MECIVSVRLKEEENEMLDNFIKKNNLTKSQFLRELILNRVSDTNMNNVSNRKIVEKLLELVLELKQMNIDLLRSKTMSDISELKEYLADIKVKALKNIDVLNSEKRSK